MKRLLLLSLLLVGCNRGFSTIEDPRTIHGVNPVFLPYLNNYLSYKQASLYYDIPIQFTDLPNFTVGLCTRWSNGFRQIEVDQYYWEHYLSEGEKQEVIDHELGHCDLNRDHDMRIIAGYPASIMYPYVFGINSLTINKYMTELFNGSSSASTSVLAVEIDDVVDIDVNK